MAKARKTTTKKKKPQNSLGFPEEADVNPRNEEEPVSDGKGALDTLVGEENINVQLPSTKKQEELLSEQQYVQKGFTFTMPVYLQVHIGNIYQIFGSAIISPAVSVNNRAFNDVQTTINTGFILSNGFIGQKDESTTLLCVNFRQEEQNDFKIQGAVAFYYKPLPISRVKSIYVSDERLKKQMIETALANDGGIIPEELIIGRFPEDLKVSSYESQLNYATNTNYDKELIRFDKILGSFAYLKNYAFLLINKTSLLTPLPDHYFFAAQALNDAPPLQIRKNERAVSFYKQLFKATNEIDNPLLNWLFKRINDNTNFSDQDVLTFGNVLVKTAKTNEFIEASKDILNALTKSLERKNTLSRIPELTDPDRFSLYLFAILRIYANLNTENKSIARADLPEIITLSYGEYVFAMLGYFFGYKALRNFDEKLKIGDAVLAKYVDITKRIPIKFEMNSLLDYVIIESAYKTAFYPNGGKIETDYIESNSIKKEYVRRPNTLPDDYTFNSNEVFGKYVYQLKRKTIYEELDKYNNELPEEIAALSDLGVFCYRNGLPVYFSNLSALINGKKPVSKFLFFKRDDILDAIKARKINASELKQRIETSKQFKEL